MPNTYKLLVAAATSVVDLERELVVLNVNAVGDYPFGDTYEAVTPLMVAASARKQEIVDFLLKRNADVDIKDSAGNSALWYALTSKNEIANNNLDHLCLSLKSGGGYKELHLATRLQLPKTVAALLAAGIDPRLPVAIKAKPGANNRNNHEQSAQVEYTTAYEQALLSGNKQVICEFLTPLGLSAAVSIGLDFAAKNPNVPAATIVYLLDQYSSFKISPQMFKNLLARPYFALEFTDQKFEELMARLEVQPQLSAVNPAENTTAVDQHARKVRDQLMLHAVESANQQAVQWMANNGFNLLATDSYGRNALFMALHIKDSAKRRSMLQFLLNNKVPTDAIYRPDGDSSIDLVCYAVMQTNGPNMLDRYTNCIEPTDQHFATDEVFLILEAGAAFDNVSIIKGLPTTPLIEACKKSTPDARVKLLLERGAVIFQDNELPNDPTNLTNKPLTHSLSAVRTLAKTGNMMAILWVLSKCSSMTENQRSQFVEHLDQSFEYENVAQNVFNLLLKRISCSRSDYDKFLPLIVKALLELGCKSYTATIDGLPIIAAAIKTSNLNVVKTLLERFTRDPNLVPELDKTFTHIFWSHRTAELKTIHINLVTLAAWCCENPDMLELVLNALQPEQKRIQVNHNYGTEGANLLFTHSHFHGSHDERAKKIKLLATWADLTTRFNGRNALETITVNEPRVFHDMTPEDRRAIRNSLTPPTKGWQFGIMQCSKNCTVFKPGSNEIQRSTSVPVARSTAGQVARPA